MKWKYVLVALYGVAIAFLLSSVIHSGYSYIFDPDELFHINTPFLLTRGMVPYREFFLTYTPIFHWFLIPLSFFTGFTFRFLEAARIAMIVLFVIRLGLIYVIARKLFGPRIAYVSIPLYLFDPFTVFSGMQVRPDNLMMTLYLTGIFLVLSWYGNKKTTVLTWAGLLLGVSSLTLLKNIPAAFIMILFILIELGKTHRYRVMMKFLFALIIPAAVFAAWAWSKGIFPSMVQQTVFDAKQLNDSLRYPENILNYYWPPNFVLYGFPGRPLTWVYELLLPLMAFAGMFTVFLTHASFWSHRKLISWVTAASFLQWASLLFVRSVFIQYFLTVSWFLALFAAYALIRTYETIGINRFVRQILTVAAILMLMGGLAVSWSANNTRAKSSWAVQKIYLTSLWRTIPESAAVFPGAVFRRNVYPLGFETNFVDIPPAILGRYGSPSVALSRFTVSFVLLDPYNFSFLDAQTQEYIKNHYRQNPKDPAMWMRGG